MTSDHVDKFMRLYRGRTDAYGTGRGHWVKSPPTKAVYAAHLSGHPPGLGIAPLLDDGNVWFAAIDLDEPDFNAAREMQDLLSFGQTFVERSRSGNAHILAFFEAPIEAWIVRGVLRDATMAVGKPTVEIFPKQDRLRTGMLGNYLNLSYHGHDRPILCTLPAPDHDCFLSVEDFTSTALENLNVPDDWRKRARWLNIESPEERIREQADFGSGKELHICAEWIIANRDSNPIQVGHRNVVYFNLAKMLRHYEGIGDDEAFSLLQLVRDSGDEQGVDHVSDYELRRIFDNAAGFSSTGCDDPLMQPYTHPSCPIAHGGK